MSREAFRNSFFATAVITLIAEIYFQYVSDDQRIATVFAILTIGLAIISSILTPKASECTPDCPKCRESES
ncbi:hypothetical protein [Streptomyces sp. ISBFB 2968]|uniref:hypothetical protein n=1 Tax=Streptomyces sp. ISBFB 2968 TaxID=2903527 RepID=UPI002FDC4E16